MKTVVLGVDPGIKGALGFWDTKTKKLVVKDFPLTEESKRKNAGRKEIDLQALTVMVDVFAREIDFAVIEEVHGMTYKDEFGQVRGQGTVQSFAFGKATGTILGVLAAFYIPIIPIRSSVWKSLLNLSSDKKESIRKANEWFPNNRGSFMRAKDDGRAEASLLAKFGADRFMGMKDRARAQRG